MKKNGIISLLEGQNRQILSLLKRKTIFFTKINNIYIFYSF